MEEVFEHEIEGCFLYSRHWNPTNKALSNALARMEAGESAQVMASGMAAISSTLLQLCSLGRRDRLGPHRLRRHLRAAREPAAALRDHDALRRPGR